MSTTTKIAEALSTRDNLAVDGKRGIRGMRLSRRLGDRANWLSVTDRSREPGGDDDSVRLINPPRT